MESSKVADITQHSWGRKDINLSEVEMPGLMELRNRYKKSQPFKNVKITGSLHMTIQTAVLIETLKDMGADIRWCSCNIFSTQDHAAAAIAQSNSATVFAWKGETLEEYWDCTYNALVWPDGSGPDMIVDDGSDATFLVHEGVKLEKANEMGVEFPNIDNVQDAEYKCVLKLIKKTLSKDTKFWHKIAKNIRGVSEETTSGVHRLIQLEKKGELLFPAMNVNDSVTKTKFDNLYGCKHSLCDSLMRSTDVMIAGKKALVCGYGDVGKGSVASLKSAGAIVMITEVDPICALQAYMDGMEVVLIEDVINDVDIFVSATGNKDIIMAEHMSKMKNNAIVCNIGHFDNEIDVNGLEKYPGIKRENIKPQVDRYVFPDGHGIILLAEGRLVNLGCATGHPSFVMSCSFTNQVLAQVELWDNKDVFDKKVYKLSRKLDEEVARLHLNKLGAKLTMLSQEQADYINVEVSGPYKSDSYKY
jgi:adenosylhomocysteinase